MANFKIKLTQGKYALVDKDLFEYLDQWRWQFDGRYATRWVNRQKIYMHRLVIGNDTLQDTDHINRDKLDNRKVNLRVCSRSRNNLNQPLRTNNTSGHKGVSWRKDSKKWRARIVLDGTEIRLGLFRSLEEAKKARRDYVNSIV